MHVWNIEIFLWVFETVFVNRDIIYTHDKVKFLLLNVFNSEFSQSGHRFPLCVREATSYKLRLTNLKFNPVSTLELTSKSALVCCLRLNQSEVKPSNQDAKGSAWHDSYGRLRKSSIALNVLIISPADQSLYVVVSLHMHFFLSAHKLGHSL